MRSVECTKVSLAIKYVCKYRKRKMVSSENMGFLLSGSGALVTVWKKAKVLTAFFAPNFTSKTVPLKAKIPETR